MMVVAKETQSKNKYIFKLKSISWIIVIIAQIM